jgi:copper chaperone CopZ
LKKYRRFFLLLIGLLVVDHTTLKAQFISATLGINGLTCSLCSYSVERELKKLDCIEQVTMDLNQNIATIRFKPNKVVRMKEVVDAVYKAGFSVGYTQALFSFNTVTIDEFFSFSYEGDRYKLINGSSQALQGEHVIQFIDKKYLVPKIYKTWEAQIKNNTKTMPSTPASTHVYHIIL